jgi:hypothetical protein
VIQATALERSADSLAALFTASDATIKTNGELRLEVLRWVLDLPPEIDPARAAQILIGRQARGEDAPFSAFAQAMIVEMGRADRASLAAFPRGRRRHAARMEMKRSLPHQVPALAPD